MSLDNKPSIYHADEFGTMAATIKLNLVAVRQLLHRSDIWSFDDLTERCKATLQRRFTIYLSRASTGIGHGHLADPIKGHEEIQPNINHLPDKMALLLAVMERELSPAVIARTKLTPNERAAARREKDDRQVWRYHSRGFSPEIMAKCMNVSMSGIYAARRRVCAEHGVPCRMVRGLRETRILVIVAEMSASGHTEKQIADALWTNAPHVKKLLAGLLRDLPGEEVAK